jgi:hypothetical protein
MNWSASSIPRLLACPTRRCCPSTTTKRRTPSEGQDHHADQEAAIDVGDEDAIHPDVLALIREGDETITEMAFAYDPTPTRRASSAASRASSTPRSSSRASCPASLTSSSVATGRDARRGSQVLRGGRRRRAQHAQARRTRSWLLAPGATTSARWRSSYRATWRRPSHATLNALDLAAHGDRLRRCALTSRRRPPAAATVHQRRPALPLLPLVPFAAAPRIESLQRRVANGAISSVRPSS